MPVRKRSAYILKTLIVAIVAMGLMVGCRPLMVHALPASGMSTQPDQTTDSTENKNIVLNDYQEFLSSGKQVNVLPGQVLNFVVDRQLHAATIKQIGKDFIVIILTSAPHDVRIKTGQTITDDVTSDNKDDIKLQLNSVNGQTAQVTFTAVYADTTIVANGMLSSLHPKRDWKKIALLSAAVVIVILSVRELLRNPKIKD